ncbi:hypothetical protein OG689_28520 [Kitasatospora sp. NBC_00240]|uniref:hypothetical protein n=1 Tax=Kitasatospora sp. NBC_00240 TaxID=2903567 RepID=UPI0022533D02|nr:hypothetical protein [Kitasatospora sp. NBC_00240]MCX5213163.1 hypothetical protein [Kitasatospora sp. NBC_00240]
MPSHRTVWTVATVAAAAFALTACGPEGSDGAAVAGPTGAAPSVSAPAAGAAASSTPSPGSKPSASSAGSAKPTASSTAGAPGGEPAEDCGPAPELHAGHAMVNVSKGSTATMFYAKSTKFACDPNDGHWADAGPEKAYGFAAGAKAFEVGLTGSEKAVTLAELSSHTTKCLNKTEDFENRPCFSYFTYEIALDSAGKITSVWEVFHS